MLILGKTRSLFYLQSHGIQGSALLSEILDSLYPMTVGTLSRSGFRTGNFSNQEPEDVKEISLFLHLILRLFADFFGANFDVDSPLTPLFPAKQVP